MRKIKTIFIMMAFIVVLIACNSNTETKNYSLNPLDVNNNDTGINSEVIVNYENDEVISVKTIREYDYERFFEVTNKKGVKELFEENVKNHAVQVALGNTVDSKPMNEMRGVSYKEKFTDSNFITEENVVLKDLDFESLKTEDYRGFVINQPFIFHNGKLFDPEVGVNLKDTIEELKKFGYSEK